MAARTPPTYDAVTAALKAVAGGKVAAGPALRFLQETGLASTAGITEQGRFAFRALFVDRREPSEIWPGIALRWRPYKILHDVFGGRPNVAVEQARSLWLLHDEPGLTSDRNVGMALTLADRLGVVVYRYRDRTLDVPVHPGTARELGHLIHPETPFANLQALERVVRQCDGAILWLDKHFGRRGLDILADCVDGTRHKAVRLLVGRNDNTGDKFGRAASRLATDLATRGVTLEARFLADHDAATTHDRWLGDGRTWFNLPPLNSILQNQHGEILHSKGGPFEQLWGAATPLQLLVEDAAPVATVPPH